MAARSNGALSIAGGTIDNTSGGDFTLNNGGAITGRSYLSRQRQRRGGMDGTVALANNPVIAVAGNTLTTQTLTQSSDTGIHQGRSGHTRTFNGGLESAIRYDDHSRRASSLLNGSNPGRGSAQVRLPLAVARRSTSADCRLPQTASTSALRAGCLSPAAGIATAKAPAGEGATSSTAPSSKRACTERHSHRRYDHRHGRLGKYRAHRFWAQGAPDNFGNLNGFTLTKIDALGSSR